MMFSWLSINEPLQAHVKIMFKINVLKLKNVDLQRAANSALALHITQDAELFISVRHLSQPFRGRVLAQYVARHLNLGAIIHYLAA
jgi:hypothetical protein